MSTTTASTSASTSASPGKCVVCGKETWMRCSSCSAHGLDWMCFCSIEHQKLIWPLHKRVCGNRSNPFRWPNFTSDEIDAFMEYSDKPLKTSKSIDSRSCLDVMEPISFPFPLSSSDRKLRLRARFEQASVTNETAMLRKVAINAHVGVLQHEGVSGPQAGVRAFIKNPINHVISTAEAHVNKITQEPSKYQPWWSDFNHKYLHIVAVMHWKMTKGATASDSKVNDIQTAMRYTADEFGRFLRQVVAKTHPQVAVQFAEDGDSQALIAGIGQREFKEVASWEVSKW